MSDFGQGPAGSSVTGLVLPEALRRQIGAEAERAHPEECCGLLIGRVEGTRAVVTACPASPNRAPDRRTGFEIDPGLLLESQRQLRATGQQVLGHYHSHPNGNAEPSETDRKRAWVPGHVWVIVASPRPGADMTFTAHLAVEGNGGIALRSVEVFAEE